jgi:hypothetical protein
MSLRNFHLPLLIPTTYVANAVEFDGINDDLSRASDFLGNADSKLGTLVCWFKGHVDVDDQNRGLLSSDAGRVHLRWLSDGKLRLRATNAAGTDVIVLESSAYTSAAGWTSLLVSFDLSDSAKRHLYINDTSDLSVVTFVNDTIDYTRNSWLIGIDTAGNRFMGCLSEFWFAPGIYIDFSIAANRRKFIDAAGKPVFLGADGSLPTGTAPILYLNGDSTDFQTNRGTGGDFTVNGALTDCADSPSDDDILLAATPSATATVAGSLSTEIRAAAAVTATTALAGQLTTEIPLTAQPAATATLAGSLTTEIPLQTALTAQAAATAQLMTEIRLLGQCNSLAAVAPALTIEIHCQSTLTASAQIAAMLQGAGLGQIEDLDVLSLTAARDVQAITPRLTVTRI